MEQEVTMDILLHNSKSKIHLFSHNSHKLSEYQSNNDDRLPSHIAFARMSLESNRFKYAF